MAETHSYDEEGEVTLCYRKPIMSSLRRILVENSKLMSGLKLGGEAYVTLEGSLDDLRSDIESFFNKYGLPDTVAKPSFDLRALVNQGVKEEWKAEKRGYELLKEMIDERGGRIRRYIAAEVTVFGEDVFCAVYKPKSNSV